MLEDKLITMSSLEDTIQTVKSAFPKGGSGGGVSTIPVTLIEVDTLTDEVGLLTVYAYNVGKDLAVGDNIVFNYDTSLYFCNIYSITNQIPVDDEPNSRMAVVVVKVITKTETATVEGGTSEPELLTIPQEYNPLPMQYMMKLFESGYTLQYGSFINAGEGWNSFYFPKPFDKKPYIFGQIDQENIRLNYLILDIQRNDKIGFNYRVKYLSANNVNFYAFSTASTTTKTSYSVDSFFAGNISEPLSINWLAIA